MWVELSRSCTNTAYTLSLIFLGFETAKKLYEYHRNIGTVSFTIPLPSGKDWVFSIHELFDGSVSHETSNDAKFNSMDTLQQIETSKNYRQKYMSRFLYEIRPILDLVKNSKNKSDDDIVKSIQEKFSVLRYDFNKTTLEFLQKDIFERAEKVNNEKSFIYVCRVTQSDPQLGGARKIEHIWILEQFFLDSTQKVAYRLYQSWIGQATLSDEFDKRKYGSNGENYWNLDNLKEFLDSINEYYCLDSTGKIATTSRECFGYSAVSFPLLKFDGKTFFGKSFQYRIYEIEPEQCIKHFEPLDRV